MHFANPAALLLLPVLGLLIFLRERSTSVYRASLPIPDLSLTRSLQPTWRTRYGRFLMWLIYTGLALGIVALARPQSVLRGEENKAKGIDILMALDTSGSMRALDFDPLDRMAAAKRATKTFIEHRKY